MFSSSILEVIIGIVFIYVLLSLLATTVNELIQTFLFSARGRDLEKAIVSMLSDRKPLEESPVKGNNPNKSIGEDNNQKTSKKDLAEEFYAHPLITKFAKQGDNNKPSYISRTTFSKVLIDLLSIPDKAYSTVNEIKSVVEQLPPDNKTRALLLSLIKDAGDDIVTLRVSFENWYDEMMDRALGWYKRRVQRALLIIGLCISAILNADTFNIVRNLSSNPDARAKIVKQAEAYRDQKMGIISTLNTQQNSLKADSLKLINQLNELKTSLKTDSLNLVRQLNELNDSTRADSINLVKQLSIKRDSLSLIEKDSVSIKLNAARLSQINNNVDSLNKQINSLREQINFLRQEEIAEATSIIGMGWDHPNIPLWENSSSKTFFSSLINKLLYILFRLPGWIITTLAITLGAPFWFDMLNKVINIRNVGLKPEEKKTTNTSFTQYTSSEQPVG
jgi:hypothetical protein